MLDVPTTEKAFESSVAAVLGTRDVVEIVGPDGAEYLHGQLSQDVLGLAVGASLPTLLLQPQGKVDAWMRLSRLADDRYWLDVDSGFGQAALERLQRFKLRVKAEISSTQLDMLSVRGPAAPAVRAEVNPPLGGAVLDCLWPGVQGFDVLGVDIEPPAGIELGAPAALEALRIRLGVPAMGSELGESTIPAAAGIVEGSVDFTKGCYVGQELVARIDSRGSNTPTSLRALRFAGGATAGPGTEIRQDESVVGHVTSFIDSPTGGPVGLGYVKRAVEPPAEAIVLDPAGRAHQVEIVALR